MTERNDTRDEASLEAAAERERYEALMCELEADESYRQWCAERDIEAQSVIVRRARMDHFAAMSVVIARIA
jgi:hypothetical protein